MSHVMHYRNMTNGLEWCRCLEPARSLCIGRVVRIQSTQIEQKQWGSVLDTLDADFLYHYAQGNVIVVHDHSERARLTRALWHGLPWIKYACDRAWYEFERPVQPAILLTKQGGQGMDVTDYFEHQWRNLPDRTLAKLRYFRKYRCDGFHQKLCARDCSTENTFPIP